MPWRRSRILAGWLMLALLPPSAGCTSSTKGADAALRDSGWGDDGSEGGVVCPGPLCDRDGDGVPDVDEDVNDDGLLGCCMERCGAPASSQSHCRLNYDGCGGSQRCVMGRCVPERQLQCSHGELDPARADTFGDGVPDGERGNYVCRRGDRSPTKLGRKVIQVIRDSSRGWALGLEPDAAYQPLTLVSARGKEAAAAIDFNHDQLAGFLLSMPPSQDSLEAAAARIRRELEAHFGTEAMKQRASGWLSRTHDGYELWQGLVFDLSLPSARDAGAVRQRAVAAILGRPEAQLSQLHAVLGSKENDYVLHMSLIRRFAFQRDATGKVVLDKDGYPKEDLSRSASHQVLASGGVLARGRFERHELEAGWKLDDLADSSLVAHADAQLVEQCDVGTISGPPRLEFVVVVDEHGDTVVRQRRAALMRSFVRRLRASGMVGRFCVVGALDPNGAQGALTGRCCAGRGGVGGGRFLEQSEEEAIASCVADPPGKAEPRLYSLAAARETVERLLPRSDDAPNKVRTRAKLVLLAVTQRRDAQVSKVLAPFGKQPLSRCKLDDFAHRALVAHLQPHVDYFKGLIDPEASALVNALGGRCASRCDGEVTHGWGYLARHLSGQWVDPCSDYVASSLQVMIDSHVGGSSPIMLQWLPVASSLRIALHGHTPPRSRVKGFDYRWYHNRLVLMNVERIPGAVSPLVVSYVRWRRPW